MALRRWRNLKIDGNSIPIIDDPPQGDGTYGTQFFTTITDDRRGRPVGWTFDKPYICDQFINGDWWIYAPDGCTVTQQIPARREADKTHGSVVDWRPEKKQCWAGKVMNILSKKNDPPLLFDKAPQDYDETHLARVPISLEPGQTLLTAEGVWDPNDVPPESDWFRKTSGALRPQVWKIAYLTVVDEIPPQYSFRPPYI